MPPITLRVWAHWTDAPTVPGYQPLPNAPVPATLTAYLPPGAIVPRNGGVPDWSGRPPGRTNDPVAAWCELAKQDDIDAANWAGAAWPGPPPPAFSALPGLPGVPAQTAPKLGDEGSRVQAIGFKVTKVTLLLAPNVRNDDFEFSIVAPDGTPVPKASPSWTGTFSVSVAIANGRGIWSIFIDRVVNPSTAAPSSVAAPALLGVPPLGPSNPVEETYVIPYAGTGEAAS